MGNVLEIITEFFRNTAIIWDYNTNIPFIFGKLFWKGSTYICKSAGFDNLKGHKSVGGLRASIYNAMPREGVEALVDFLRDFEAAHN